MKIWALPSNEILLQDIFPTVEISGSRPFYVHIGIPATQFENVYAPLDQIPNLFTAYQKYIGSRYVILHVWNFILLGTIPTIIIIIVIQAFNAHKFIYLCKIIIHNIIINIK